MKPFRLAALPLVVCSLIVFIAPTHAGAGGSLPRTAPAAGSDAAAGDGRPVPASPTGDRVVVRLAHGLSASEQRLDDLDYAAPLRSISPLGIVVLRVLTGTAEAAIARLTGDPRVATASLDPALHTALIPNDRAFSRQWALQMIQAPYAWELTRGSAGVVVGVLDSGVDLTHPDLAAHVLPIGCNLIADQQCMANGLGTPPNDDDGHGSHVAGIVAAVTDNHEGIAGIAWNASILPVRLTLNGIGAESDFITGVVWAVDRGATVLNFSFSEPCGAPETAALRDALAYAWNHGAVLVASAGNDSGCATGEFPAADEHVLAVASTDMNDKPSSFSNFGPWVRIAAPGERILSTWAHGEYSIGSGTSMAAPQVSGVATLLMSIPHATNKLAVGWMLATCDVPSGWNPAYGCGRVNAFRAVSVALRGIDPHNGPTSPLQIHLLPGWNNLLYLGATRQVDVALAQIRGKFTSVYAWDPVRTTWSTYLPGQVAASDLLVLQERGAYWVYMQTAADLSMTPTGTDPPPQVTLTAGWNNLALPTGSLPGALAGVGANAGAVFGWDSAANDWRGFFADVPAVSDLVAIGSGSAYWVYARTPIVVRFTR